MTYQAIALSFGYVESAKIAWLVFQADAEFSSRKDAFHSLTEYLYRAFCKDRDERISTENKYKTHMAKCCRKAWAQNNKLERCPECEAVYKDKAARFSITDWQEFLFDVLSGDANSHGYLFFEVNSGVEVSWDPFNFRFGVPPEQMIVISEQAEVLLTIALAKIHPELKNELDDDEDGIFGEGDEEPWFMNDYRKLIETEK